MKTKETKVYQFSELSDEAKETAIEKLADINVNYEWWDCEYNAAENVGLKLESFNLDRNRHCTGEFIESAENTAKTILREHGESCKTYKTAQGYIEESAKLSEIFPEKLDEDDYDDNEYDREQMQDELDDEFLKSMLEDYSIILQKQYEYLSSKEAIIETIETKEYEFTEDGQIA